MGIIFGSKILSGIVWMAILSDLMRDGSLQLLNLVTLWLGVKWLPVILETITFTWKIL